MRKPEQRLWDDLSQAMGGSWHARRIEDRLGAGLPDVVFTGQKRKWAFMELKQVPVLPQEGGRKPFDLPGLTADQRGFGLEAFRHGGAHSWWLMTRVGSVDLLHRPSIIDQLGTINFTTFRKKAAWVGKLGPEARRPLLDILFV